MSPGRSMLLIVDDEERILSALRRALRREDFEIVTAQGPREGLAELRAREVAVVLSDYKMPEMSGLEFLARAARIRPAAARLLLTGWPDEVPPARIGALGIQAVIAKPWDDAELKAALRSARRAPHSLGSRLR